jgi:protein-disulfide isomerase
MRADEFLNIVNKSSKENKYKLGTIDPSYSKGRPRVIFDGEDTPSQKKYPYLGSYTPGKNDRVLLLSVSGTYVVLGKVII